MPGRHPAIVHVEVERSRRLVLPTIGGDREVIVRLPPRLGVVHGSMLSDDGPTGDELAAERRLGPAHGQVRYRLDAAADRQLGVRLPEPRQPPPGAMFCVPVLDCLRSAR
jgi:hypothetical protein